MIDSIPLIQNANDAQQINASIIAMKKASRELDEKIVKLNSLNSELDKKIALLDSGLNKEIEDRKEAINSLDVSSVGGSGKYISAISETDGKISATASDITSSVSSGNSQPVTSGGVADAIAPLQPIDSVTSGNLHPVTSNAVYASELTMRNGSRMVTKCFKLAGDYARHWAKLFSFSIGRQYDDGVCFFEILGHSINRGSKTSGYIGGYTQDVSDPYIWNSSNTLNNSSLYYSKGVQSDGNVLITVYVPTFTDNYMWWELNLSSNKDLIIYNSPDLITDVSGLIAFITS